MESSILSEVDDTSISGRGSLRRYGRPLNWLAASRLWPRAAGWSAATLCFGTKRNCFGAHRKFGSWRQTGRIINLATQLPLTLAASKPSHDMIYWGWRGIE
jgi:hypothetical protein